MIDKIYSKKIIFNHILMTIAPSVKSYLPGPQRGGGWSMYDAELNTQIHSEIFKMLVHVFVKQEICNSGIQNVTHTKCGAPWGIHMFKKTYSEWNNLS